MSTTTTRPIIMGRKGVVTAGHYLAATAGHRMIENGGNAIDAAAAMSFCLNLLEPQSCGIAGEVPILIYSAKDRKTYAISGVGWSPKNFSIEWCKNNGIDLIPGDGYLPITVPAPVGTWAAAISQFGTLSFSEILQPTIELAENGYPMYEGLYESLLKHKDKYLTKPNDKTPNIPSASGTVISKYFKQYPTTGEIYLPKGKPQNIGELVINRDFANMLKIMTSAEKNNLHKGRIKVIQAACDAFYKGEITEQILEFLSANPIEDASGNINKSLLSYEDMAEWNAEIEEPAHYNYRGLDVWKCSTWTQGPVFLQQLAILEKYNLTSMQHNSSEYLHTIIETSKLAFADREAYYGDPKFDEVPLKYLLSDSYNNERQKLIESTASMKLNPGTMPGQSFPEYISNSVQDDNRYSMQIAKRPIKDLGIGHAHMGDTTHLDAVDSEGNMVAATPSGGWIGTSPVIKGLGFPMGTRGQMFYLNHNRPNALAPRKRPRATLTPSMVTKDNKPFMAFGTPGGDSQDQWTLQFFLNHVDFKMNLQEALDAPTIHSVHFPSSFYPRKGFPGVVAAENDIPKKILEELEQRGHKIEITPKWSNGKTMSVSINPKNNILHGACTAKGSIGYSIGW